MSNKISLNTPLSNIHFGVKDVRIHNCLDNPWPLDKQFDTLYDLVTTSRERLKKIHNMGISSLNGIEDVLAPLGLCLGMTDEEAKDYDGSLGLIDFDKFSGHWRELVFDAAKLIEVELLKRERNIESPSCEQEAAERAVRLAEELHEQICKSVGKNNRQPNFSLFIETLNKQ